jgi:hypothetical protein
MSGLLGSVTGTIKGGVSAVTGGISKGIESVKSIGGSGGTEKRESILPTMAPEDTGYILPSYDFAANMPMPDTIGVVRDNTLGSVVSAAKGVMYYADMIGFGNPSSDFTRGMPFRKLGINFFTKTGLKCSNGADMWTYFEGIPKGDALGKTLQVAMNNMKYPQLQGLAPGIIEDTKAALNPRPIIQAAFGNPYAVCELVTKQVGDDIGNLVEPPILEKIRDKDGNFTGETRKVKGAGGQKWIYGEVDYINGVPTQTRWVQKVDEEGNPVFITQKQFDDTPKTYNPDGTPINVSGFEDAGKASLVVAVVLLCGAFAFTYSRKK